MAIYPQQLSTTSQKTLINFQNRIVFLEHEVLETQRTIPVPKSHFHQVKVITVKEKTVGMQINSMEIPITSSKGLVSTFFQSDVFISNMTELKEILFGSTESALKGSPFITHLLSYRFTPVPNWNIRQYGKKKNILYKDKSYTKDTGTVEKVLFNIRKTRGTMQVTGCPQHY